MSAGKSTNDFITYADAGVSIDAGDALVSQIKGAVAQTHGPAVLEGLGGFGGFFDLSKAGFPGAPILVGATDGVGTKLMIAQDANRHDTIGQDLVAMCTNDLICTGAKPLFFLDYFATGRLNPAAAAQVVRGIAAACKTLDVALIGGETAEMPGLYAPGHYDLAGFAVGAVLPQDRLPKAPIGAGDYLYAQASSGLHSNGFSLVRKVFETAGLNPAHPKWLEHVLMPTRLYRLENIAGAKAVAHITGGGISENLPRILPAGLGAEIDLNAWQMPEIFTWLMDHGPVDEGEMLRTFNCGVGLIGVFDPEVDPPEGAFLVGRITDGAGVVYRGALRK